MSNEPGLAPIEGIETMIHVIRGQRVMLDSDLAKIYGVTTKRLNEQHRRNTRRFPKDHKLQPQITADADTDRLPSRSMAPSCSPAF